MPCENALKEDVYCGSKKKYDTSKYSDSYTAKEVRDMAKACGVATTVPKRKVGKKTKRSHSKSKAAMCRELRACSRGHCVGSRPTWSSAWPANPPGVWTNGQYGQDATPIAPVYGGAYDGYSSNAINGLGYGQDMTPMTPTTMTPAYAGAFDGYSSNAI